MAKFKNSSEAIDSSLLLWDSVKPTNTSIREIYDILVYPANSVDQAPGSSILFNIPPQETGMLIDVEIVTKFHVKHGEDTLTATPNVAPVSNIATAMWSLVDFRLEERVNLLQQMSNSYNLSSFFETLLNNNADRADILSSRELFVLDVGTKAQTDEAFFHPTTAKPVVFNTGGQQRSNRIKESRKVTVISKLNVPLIKQHKAMLPSTKFSVTLTKAKDSYCLIGAEDSGYVLLIDDVYLKCTYVKPEDNLLRLILSKLEKSSVVYEVDKQQIIARMLPLGARNYTVTNIFEKALPKFALFAVQSPEALNGVYEHNVFTFLNIRSLQVFINNTQYFAKPLTNIPNGTDWGVNSQYLLDNLYKTTRRDLHGSMLITRDNINLYQFYTVCLADDRTYGTHYGLKQIGDTRIEIDLGASTTANVVLLVYCVYDQQIFIDNQRNVTVVE